jgi:hypothetical protein
MLDVIGFETGWRRIGARELEMVARGFSFVLSASRVLLRNEAYAE